MALSTRLDVNLVTPKGVVAHTNTDSVLAPGEQGEFQLLGGHVPLLTALKAGVVQIGKTNPVEYAVSSGYLRVDQAGSVEILVEQAVPASEIDKEGAKAELAAAKAELERWGDRPIDAEHQIVQQRADWAKAKIDAADMAAKHH
jgi:F-type H+-transporting ATPase subunit epsilon